jgi:hypothetical protein
MVTISFVYLAALEADQQHARRFIVMILRHKPAPESFREDRLIKVVDQSAGAGGLCGETVSPREGALDTGHNLALLVHRGTGVLNF